MALEPTRLVVEPLQRPELLLLPELGFLNRRLQRLNCLIVDAKRNRKRMPVLAAMRQRETGGIAEAIWRAMHDFGDHRQGAHGTRADARDEQELREIARSAIRG